MVNIFFKENDKLKLHQGISDIENIPGCDIVWIDLLQPSYEERIAIETRYKITLQTRQEIEEIEVSSRYFESDTLIVTNSHFLIPTENEFRKEPISFILKDHILFSHRNSETRTFTEIYRRIDFNFKLSDAYHVFLSIFEIRIDLDADMIEAMVKDISSISGLVTREKTFSEEILVKISKFQEDTMQLRENIIDKQRVLSAVLKSDYFPQELHNKIRVMIKDTGSLLDYTVFSFERLDFLQNTFLGLVNIEQNKIIKIFTVATVIFMPPTLIASIYGMNFKFMPEIGWKFGYLLAIFLMIFSVAVTLILFKKRKWL
ncbi:MAG: magnesium/cobalt transporter CorA [Bacteroidia bacterium]|nr:magnesium/cobalt transporter CorA [Bacteroidia bacterium]